ncbi:hypothetical protein OG223_17200 [Streptomyces sp. NBC_01478]|jgi:hypothetical protein|uniref:hypothetical protein n=1 Tax=Streptomyces sp. NBC_01478 TaxID=2903882 RepID=UPI002E380576|nr:hypothetical protein [Streptomyces sp. NBC_01478]
MAKAEKETGDSPGLWDQDSTKGERWRGGMGDSFLVTLLVSAVTFLWRRLPRRRKP